MTNWYEVGKVYIWQGQVGKFAQFNDQETTVIEGIRSHFTGSNSLPRLGQQTDSEIMVRGEPHTIIALPGDLRPKNPPPGEQSITNLFKLTEPEPV